MEVFFKVLCLVSLCGFCKKSREVSCLRFCICDVLIRIAFTKEIVPVLVKCIQFRDGYFMVFNYRKARLGQGFCNKSLRVNRVKVYDIDFHD